MIRALRRCARWSCVLLALFVVLAVAAWIGLRVFSPKLAVLYPAIRNAAERAAPGWNVEFGAVEIDWVNRWFVPGVEARDVRIGRPEAEPAVTVPRLLLVFDLADLIRGRFSPAALELDDPRIVTSRFAPPVSAENAFGTDSDEPETSGESPADEPAAASHPELWDRLRRTADALALDLPLRKIQIRDLRILSRPDDPAPLRLAGIRGRLERTSDAVRATLDLRTSGRGDPGRLSFGLELPRSADTPARAVFDLEAATPGRLSELHPRLAPLAGIDLPVTGTVRAELSPDGRLAVPEIRLRAEGGRIDRPDLWNSPLTPREIVFEAALSDGTEWLELTRFVLDFGGPVFAVSGRIGPLPRPRDWALDGTLDRFPVDEIDRYWPVGLIPPTRSWLVNHLAGGTVDGATFAVRLRPEDFGDAPLPREAVSAEAPFSGLTLTYLSSMAPARELAGTARFSARDIDFDVTGGTNYDSAVTGGTVRIAPLSPDEPARIDIAATADGPADDLPRAAADLFDLAEPPVSIAGGRAETDLSFAFPLSDFRLGEFRWAAESRVRDLSIPDLGGFEASLDRCVAGVSESGEISLTGDGGTVARTGYFRKPLAISSLRGTGHLPGKDGEMPVEIRADVEGVRLLARGNIAPAADPAALDLNIELDRLTLETALACWPEPLIPGVRDWIGKHMASGTAVEPRVRIDLEARHQDQPELPLTSVEAVIPFENVRLTGLLSLPPVESVAGTARFTARELTADVTGATVSRSTADSGTVRISGLSGSETPVLRVEAALNGPAGDLRAMTRDLLTRTDAEIPPVEPPDADIRTRIVLELPLGSNPSADAPRLSVDAEPAAPVRIGTIPLSKAHVEVRFVPAGAEVGGHVTSQGLRIEMTPVPASGLVEGGVRLAADLAEAEFARLGLPSWVRVSGRAPAELALRPGEDAPAFALDADLTPTRLEIPALGWTKVAGVPAALSLAGAFHSSERRLVFSEIRLDGTDIDVAGTGNVLLDGGETVLRLDPVRIGPHRAALELSRTPGQLRVRLTGERVDLRPVLDRLRGAVSKAPRKPYGPAKTAGPRNASAAGPAVAVSLDLDRVFLAGGKALRNLGGEIRRNPSGRFSGEIRAELGTNAAFRLNAGNDGALSLRAEDAEALLRGLGISENIRGGSLELTAAPTGPDGFSGPVAGRFVLRDPTVLGAPWLVRLLSAASLVGLVNELRGGGLQFSEVKSGFQYRSNVVAISDGRAEGFAMGLTAEGTVDLGRKTADLEGLVIPFNIVNKFVGAIPLLGKLIGEGIIATNFRLTGPLDDPDVEIQPLSALPVGAIRDLFKNIELQPLENSASDLRDRQPGYSPK